MTRNKTHALLLAAALGGVILLASPAPAASAPAAPAAQSQQLLKTHFVVVQMLSQSIQVRSLTDTREVHMFSFSPEVRDKMQKILNAGGYRYGDKVVIWYRSGGDVALKIKGKPSKPK